MGILEILNLILGLVLEPIALVYSAYYFMSNVERYICQRNIMWLVLRFL